MNSIPGGNEDSRSRWHGPVVAIGASAGGVDALRQVVSLLPGELDLPLLVVVHTTAGPNVLPRILERSGPLPAVHAGRDRALTPGLILVAPPDRHLVVDGSTATVTSGPRENGHRPAIDTLFRSVAHSFGAASMAIVLSGMLDDGAYGARLVRRSGGTVLVQRPETAQFPSMPQAAIDANGATSILTLEEIAAQIASFALHAEAGERGPGRAGGSPTAPGSPEPEGQQGTVSSYVCPNCGGALWEHDDGELLRFRCRTGHAYSPESLMDVNAQALDDALWGAYRALLERSDLAHRLSDRFASRGLDQSSERWRDIGDEASRRAGVLSHTLGMSDGEPPGSADPDAAR